MNTILFVLYLVYFFCCGFVIGELFASICHKIANLYSCVPGWCQKCYPGVYLCPWCQKLSNKCRCERFYIINEGRYND